MQEIPNKEKSPGEGDFRGKIILREEVRRNQNPSDRPSSW